MAIGMNGGAKFNPKNFMQMCEELEAGKSITVQPFTSVDVVANVIKKQYKDALLEKYGTNLQIAGSVFRLKLTKE